jgi:hypothetical protein
LPADPPLPDLPAGDLALPSAGPDPRVAATAAPPMAAPPTALPDVLVPAPRPDDVQPGE